MQTGFVIGDRGIGASGDTHPNWMLGYATTESIKVVGASVVGKLHQAHSLPRDDAFIVRSLGPWVAVAVSDGVGSRPLSRYGAAYIVESLSSLLLRPLTPKLSSVQQAQLPPTEHARRTENAQEAEQKPLPALTVVRPSESRARGLLASVLRRIFGPNDDSAKAISPAMQFGSWGWTAQQDRCFQNGNGVSQEQEKRLGDESEEGSTPQPASGQSGEADGASSKDEHTASGAAANPPDLTQVVQEAFRKTHIGLRQHAQYLNLSLSDLSCTALGVLMNTQTGTIAAGQVGDGAIIGLQRDGAVSQLLDPPDPEDGQTVYTINRPEFERYLATTMIGPEQGSRFGTVLVMTDGVSADLLYAPRQVLEKWVRHIAAQMSKLGYGPEAATELFNYLNSYEVKGSWDDRTLVILAL